MFFLHIEKKLTKGDWVENTIITHFPGKYITDLNAQIPTRGQNVSRAFFFLLVTDGEVKNVRARYEETALENITSWYQYYFVIISYL